MAKEILLYGDIYGYSAEQAVNQLDAAKNSPEVALRFNGDGGELRYGWAIIGKAKEIKGKKLFKNDGEANSMMAFAFCYNDNNEALDTSLFKFHRASYGERYETEFATPEELQELKNSNDKLRAAMEAKINVAEFTRVTDGVTMDALFAMPGRKEVCLNAEQALAIGLINRITPITPEYKEQVRALASFYSPNKIAAHSEPTIPTTMTVEEIKAKYPDAYKAIYAKGKTRGIEIELDRAGSILAYIDADPKGVIEAHKSGKPMTETMRSEFALKAYGKTAVKTLENEGADPVQTDPNRSAPNASAKTEADKKATADFNKALDDEYRKNYPNSKKYAK